MCRSSWLNESSTSRKRLFFSTSGGNSTGAASLSSASCPSVSRWPSGRCSCCGSRTRTPTSSDISARSGTASSLTSPSSCVRPHCSRLLGAFEKKKLFGFSFQRWVKWVLFLFSSSAAVRGGSIPLPQPEPHNSAGTNHVRPRTPSLAQYRCEKHAQRKHSIYQGSNNLIQPTSDWPAVDSPGIHWIWTFLKPHSKKCGQSIELSFCFSALALCIIKNYFLRQAVRCPTRLLLLLGAVCTSQPIRLQVGVSKKDSFQVSTRMHAGCVKEKKFNLSSIFKKYGFIACVFSENARLVSLSKALDNSNVLTKLFTMRSRYLFTLLSHAGVSKLHATVDL